MDYSHNCGGYALGTKDWFEPYSDFNDFDCDNEDYTHSFFFDNVKNFVDYMLNVFENVRTISDIKDIKEKERVVAFRCGITDFHFVKVNHKTNSFRHKAGAWDVEKMTEEEFYSDIGWCGGKYNSEIYYLAINGSKVKYSEFGKEIYL